MAGIGELAAFGTAVTWGITNQMQSAVGRMVGFTGVTLLRMPYQICFIGLLCLVLQAETPLTLEGFLFLALSGVTGVFLCDYFLYSSIGIIGPAMAVLLLSSGSISTALLGWIFLDETLSLQVVAGIGITVTGILFVLTEHSGSTLLPGQEVPMGSTLIFGVCLGATGALMLSISFVFLKFGLRTGVDPLWATFVRVTSGAVVLWSFGATRGWVRQAMSGLKQFPKVYWILLISCTVGGTGMWLATVAVNKAPIGVAATLIGLQPIMVTLIGACWYRKMPSLRVIAGTLIAFGGTALICLR